MRFGFGLFISVLVCICGDCGCLLACGVFVVIEFSVLWLGFVRLVVLLNFV